MKLSTELKSLPLVSIAEGEEVGVVKDFVIDPITKSIVAIIIEDTGWYEGAKVVSFSLIHSIGDFAITTENTSAVVSLSNMPELTDLIKKKLKIVDAKVITRGGRLIGYVKEYSIDDRTGEIIGLELRSDANIGSPDRNIIPSDCVVTIGKDIIIVNEDVESSLKSEHASAAVPGAARPVAAPAAPRPRPVEPAFRPAPAQVFEPAPAPAEVIEEAPAPKGEGIDSTDDVDIEELLELDSAAESSGAVEEPAVTSASFEAADEFAAAPADESKESLSEIFERRQIKYMLGKKVSKDIFTEDGRLIIGQGDVIG
ncbi:MAG TPA: PRC-barrel domain-containing protein, partial [bacterium]|nr:PRC-barrel domain-containing protein [bacterium]